jgi:fructokinase
MNLRIVGVGEVLWDLLQNGPQLGGAPANFAYHAHALGAQASVITRVGSDEHGREVLRRFRAMGLDDSLVQVDDTHPTGTAKVELSGNGLAHFTILEDAAWDHIALTPEALAAESSADAICFGSLAQRNNASRKTIQQLVAAAPETAIKVFDINLRQHFYSRPVVEESLRLANVLKLNDDELPTLAAMFDLVGNGSSPNTLAGMPAPHEQIEQLVKRFGLRVVALTRGANGSLLYQGGRWSDCSSHPVKVVDTVGAGDSFTAAMVLGLLHKIDLDAINELANEVARYVCSQAGATPALPAEFARRVATAAAR